MDLELVLMEGIIVAIITACTTVLSVVAIEAVFGKRTFHLLEKHVDRSDASKKEVLDSSNSHYQGLTSEHEKILHLQGILKEKAESTAALVGSTSKDLTNGIQKIHTDMEVEKAEQRNRYDNLTDYQKTIADSISNLSLFSNEMQKLSLDNVRLNVQNQSLRAECRGLRGQVQSLETENHDWHVKFDALILDANKQIASRDEQLMRLKNHSKHRDFSMEI